MTILELSHPSVLFVVYPHEFGVSIHLLLAMRNLQFTSFQHFSWYTSHSEHLSLPGSFHHSPWVIIWYRDVSTSISWWISVHEKNAAGFLFHCQKRQRTSGTNYPSQKKVPVNPVNSYFMSTWQVTPPQNCPFYSKIFVSVKPPWQIWWPKLVNVAGESDLNED